jgi:pilus assembly protein Flp/PilA
MNNLRSILKDEEGAAVAEYGIMVALIAVVIVLAATLFGINVSEIFNGKAG